MKLVLTGASGLLGQNLVDAIQKDSGFNSSLELLTPSHQELDLNQSSLITQYITQQKPEVIIHAAGFIDANAAEKERGDGQGMAWKINVIGTQTIVQAAKKCGSYVVYISTGSVFNGTEQNPGPFSEKDVPISDSRENNWYGYTKYLGERMQPDAIIRISHILGTKQGRTKMDYLHRLVNLYHESKLFPLFTDQLFPLTYVPDLFQALKKIVEPKKEGTFHVITSDATSPYELLTYALYVSGEPVDERIEPITLDDFYAKGNNPIRFPRYAQLTGDWTNQTLGFRPHAWKEAVREVFGNEKS